MRKQICTLLLLLASLSLYADEFVVRSFKPAPADLSAIQYEYLDVNDKKCAIIKVRTDLRNLSFDCGKNPARDIEFRDGEYWLYVSPGEKRITLIKDGFITLHYQIQIPVVSSRVYVFEITNLEKGSAATGSMVINTEPNGAQLQIKELSGLLMSSPAELTDYPAFPYTFTISKDRYESLDTILTLHPNENIIHKIRLKPLWGDLIITVDPPDAAIYVDDEFFGTGSQQLFSAESGIDIGKHKITVVKESFKSIEKTINISNGNNGTLEYKLRPVMGFLVLDVQPPDADLRINGAQIFGLPFMDSLQVGMYKIDIQREGYLQTTKTVEVLPNKRLSLVEELKHTKTVKLSSDPSQADIYLDGNFMGRTPENILLTYGKNNIILKKTNYRDLAEELTVSRETERFDLKLEPRKYSVEITSSPPGANIYVENIYLHQTPANLDIPYGRYQVKVEKRGYFRKRKTIPVKNDNQRFNFSLKTLNHFRVGFLRGAESWGGEITYVDNLLGMGLGYFQPPKLKFDHEINHPNIYADDYYDLEPSASLGKVTNSDSINFKITAKVHVFLNKVPTLSFVLGMAIGRIHYANVHQANTDYVSFYPGEDIHSGEYYSIAKKGNIKASPIAGVSLRFFRYFYANAEYWFFTEKGTAFFYGMGICVPLN